MISNIDKLTALKQTYQSNRNEKAKSYSGGRTAAHEKSWDYIIALWCRSGGCERKITKQENILLQTHSRIGIKKQPDLSGDHCGADE